MNLGARINLSSSSPTDRKFGTANIGTTTPFTVTDPFIKSNSNILLSLITNNLVPSGNKVKAFAVLTSSIANGSFQIITANFEAGDILTWLVYNPS
jgi:hypothetical protein